MNEVILSAPDEDGIESKERERESPITCRTWESGGEEGEEGGGGGEPRHPRIRYGAENWRVILLAERDNRTVR